jgi:hypothetical protein
MARVLFFLCGKRVVGRFALDLHWPQISMLLLQQQGIISPVFPDMHQRETAKRPDSMARDLGFVSASGQG